MQKQQIYVYGSILYIIQNEYQIRISQCQYENAEIDSFLDYKESPQNFFNKGQEIKNSDETENSEVLFDEDTMLLIELKKRISVWYFSEKKL